MYHSFMAFQSIGEMMESFAAEAISVAAREYKIELDYGADSLQQIESILAMVYERSQHGMFADLAAKPSGDQDLERNCKLWGGYLGEVVRRRWGGEWTLAPYPGWHSLVPSIEVNGSRLFPLMKIHRRLTQGSAESVWNFYQMLSGKLGPQTTLQ